MPTSSEFGVDPDPVTFPSADGRTILTGYLWRPERSGCHAALVMLHGRTGAYMADDVGVFTARTLRPRHRMWGHHWRSLGFVALLVDSFGPRGYVIGFPPKSLSSRPPEVSERHVRPLDAYGALAWLRSRSFVEPARIGLQGWSNGAMAVLWGMHEDMVRSTQLEPIETGFRAALAFYPNCKFLRDEARGYRPYAPVKMLLGGSDDETPPDTCITFADTGTAPGAALSYYVYPGAEHNFDDPRRTGRANRDAREDAKVLAADFIREHLT